jgi:hypothetical protein
MTKLWFVARNFFFLPRTLKICTTQQDVVDTFRTTLSEPQVSSSKFNPIVVQFNDYGMEEALGYFSINKSCNTKY